MIGLKRSNLGIFLLRKSSIDVGLLCWSARGFVIWQHIHPSTHHLCWEEACHESMLFKNSMDLRIILCRNSSMPEWVPGALQTGSIPLTAPNLFFIVSLDWIPFPQAPGSYSGQTFFSSSFTWFHPISAAFYIGVGRSYPFRCKSWCQPPLCPPTSVRQRSILPTRRFLEL